MHTGAPPPAFHPSTPLQRSTSTHNSASRPKPRPNKMVTPDEYNSLPLSIQKKYFSSVERLRIAQQAAVETRKKQPTQEACLSPKPSMDSFRPRTSSSYKPSSLSQFRKSCLTPNDADVDADQALRFLALPAKVKRSHFTREELVLLTESSERALGTSSALAEDGYQRCAATHRKGSVGSSHYQSSVTSDEFHDDMEKDWLEVETDSTPSFEGYDPDILRIYYDRGRQGSDCSTLSSLPPFPPRDSSRRESRRVSSFSRRRAIPLSPLPLPPPRLRPAVPPLPSPGAISTLNSIIYSPCLQSPPVETTPSTRYYKDSNARSKLREYLSSAEKFDEALEFGFPTECGSPERSTSLASSTEQSVHAEMDELSLVDSTDEDEEARSQSPRTPSVINEGFQQNTTPHHSAVDSGVMLPFTPGKESVRSLSPIVDGREMTLRMTLTRSDLRAPEQELYAFQRREASGVDVEKADPLALGALPVCDDHSGAQGAFAVSRSAGGGFKKAWKNIRGRPYHG